MSHRVPNLDVGSSELNHLHPFYSPPRKGEADLAPSLFFSDQGGEDYTNDRKQAGGCNPNNAANHLSWMETESEEKGAHVHAMGREPALPIDVPPGHLPFQDDEMLSWLQYPIEDTYNRSYCSEQLCEQEFTSYPAEGSFLGSIPVESQKLSSTNYSLQLMEPSDSDTRVEDIRVEALTADVAMTMGAHRAAGHLPQDGAEAFNRVHTTMQSSHNISPSKATDTSHSALEGLQNSGKQNALNFPFFSQRIAAMKTSLQVLGTSSGPSNKKRVRQPYITQANERSSFVEKSTVTALTSFEASDMSVQGKETNQGTAKAQEKFLGPTKSDDNVGNAKKEFNPCGAAIGTETGGDVTLTSLSGGSDYSTEKSAKETVSLSCKRKSFLAEEFECESKDIGGAASQEKVPTMDRSNSGKKTRAAEIHNQSERRRRNKINDKMKALQELIPNANKTDKASMLDEAIEYVKMLQAQLQLMSMRTGMIVPPVMMPPGMQYLSVQQRLGTAQMNMGGMDVGRGIGIGVMDGSTNAFARPAFLGQPLPGQLYHAAGYQPNGLPSVGHDVHNHMHLYDKNNASAFQQLQPVHLQRTANMHRACMQANSDLRKQQ